MAKNEDKIDSLIALLTQDFKVVDLSHVLEEDMPGCVGHAKFGHILFESYKFGDISCHYQVTLSEHTGTHIDAPLHFIPDGEAHYGIDKVDLNKTMGRAAFIDASDISPNGLVTRAKIEKWEKSNGSIKTGDIVLFRFGWDRYWATRPNDKDFIKDWPGLGKDATEYLVNKGIRAVGTDAFSMDASDSETFDAHRMLLSNQVYIIENLNHLDQLPAFSFVIALPLKIKDGSGSPLRIVAFVPKDTNS
jgi:kynurenine formamidase